MLIRPVTESDIDAIVELSAQADFGLTTLPSNVDYLTTRIQRARRAFADIPDEPGGESYFFVLEDSISEKLLGTSGIVSRVGGFEPFYAYEVRMAVRESKKLGIKREVPVLHLSAQHDGPCEIDPSSSPLRIGVAVSVRSCLRLVSSLWPNTRKLSPTPSSPNCAGSATPRARRRFGRPSVAISSHSTSPGQTG